MLRRQSYAAVLISWFPQILLHHSLHHPDLLHTSKHHLALTFLLQPKAGVGKEKDNAGEGEREKGIWNSKTCIYHLTTKSSYNIWLCTSNKLWNIVKLELYTDGSYFDLSQEKRMLRVVWKKMQSSYMCTTSCLFFLCMTFGLVFSAFFSSFYLLPVKFLFGSMASGISCSH